MRNSHAKLHDMPNETNSNFKGAASITATMIESTPGESSERTADLAKSVLEGSDLSSVESELLESDSDVEMSKSTNYKSVSKASDTIGGVATTSKNPTERQIDAIFGSDDSSFSAISSLSESDNDDPPRDNNGHCPLFTSNQQRHSAATSYARSKQHRKSRDNGNGMHSTPFRYESTDSDDSIRENSDTLTNQQHDGGVFTGEESDGGDSMSGIINGSDLNGSTRPVKSRKLYSSKHGTGSARRRVDPDGMRPNQRDRSGRTPIFRCIASNDLNGLKRWIDVKANVNVRDHAGWTPIHEACIYGNLDVVRCLIENRANVNAAGKNGDTPLHDAARRGWQDVVEVLLQAGANPDIANKKDNDRSTFVAIPTIRNHLSRRLRLQQLTTARDRAGQTMLHRACSRNRISKVLDLLNCGANVEACDYAGWTPLHEAALEGHTGIVKLLLANNANANAKGHGGDTSLHDASQNGHVNVVRLLLEHGADPRITNDEGKRPIDVATDAHIIELLRTSTKQWKKSAVLDKKTQDASMEVESTISFTSSSTNTPLSPPSSNSMSQSPSRSFDRSDTAKMDANHAMQFDSVRVNRAEGQPSLHRRLQSLPAIGSGNNNIDKDNGIGRKNQLQRKKGRATKPPRRMTHKSRSQSPYTRASMDKSDMSNSGAPLSREERKMKQLMATIQRIEERAEKKRQRRLYTGRSASPQTNARSEEQQFTVDRRDSPANSTTDTATTTAAVQSTSTSTVKRRPGRPRRSSQTSVSVDHSTSVKDRADDKSKESKGRVQDMTELDRRARHRDSSGRTALHRRAKRNDLENAQQLLAHGADVNCRDNAGWSPLHEAALAGHTNMVRLLLSHGANVAVQAENLDTPLHDAAEAGYVEVVQLLLEAGASPTVKNEHGKTPLDLVDVEAVKDDEERRIATEIRELLVSARRSQNRRSRVRLTSMDNKRVTGDDAVMSDASNTSLRRKRRLVSGRQLASRKHESDENGVNNADYDDDDYDDDSPDEAVVNNTTVTTTTTNHGDSRQQQQQQQEREHRSRRTSIKETTHQHKKKKREVNKRTSKTPESDVSTARHHKRTSVVVKQEDDILDQQQQLRPTKDTLKVKVKTEPSSGFDCTDGNDDGTSTRTRISVPLKARFFPPNTPQLDMAHAKRFLPLYTVQLDTTTTTTTSSSVTAHATGSVHSITNESATGNGHSAFFVIDLQVRHLLDLPSHLTLFARYPDLQRRPVGQREKERFWGPLAYMLMANVRSNRSASPQPMPTSTSAPEWKEQEKQRFLATDLYFVRLDDVASLIRRDYPYLSEQLITIKLDLGFSDESSSSTSSCTRNNDTTNDPMMSKFQHHNLHQHHHLQHHHHQHAVSSVMNNPTFSLPAKFAMKLNKQLNHLSSPPPSSASASASASASPSSSNHRS
ncbi:hypothetical protein BDF22DRAFT_745205 [Syncephalis plumigaleata]|nr:hypothetical protein BDF22DRAFT_745205 [Syncephalis plumigaleata]